MAKARSWTIERPRSAELDDSSEHPALTPLMRRLAREQWEIVRAKAEEQGLPIVKAWISPYWDAEDGAVFSWLCIWTFPRSRPLRFTTASTPPTTSGSPGLMRKR